MCISGVLFLPVNFLHGSTWQKSLVSLFWHTSAHSVSCLPALSPYSSTLLIHFLQLFSHTLSSVLLDVRIISIPVTISYTLELEQENSWVHKRISRFSLYTFVLTYTQKYNIAASLHRFGGQTASGKALVLVSVFLSESGQESSVTVNCEKMVISSMLLKEIQSALKNV